MVKFEINQNSFEIKNEIIDSIFQNDIYDIHYDDDIIFGSFCGYGTLDDCKLIYELSIKYNSSVTVNTKENFAFKNACFNDNLEVAKWLYEINADLDICFNDNFLIKICYSNNNLKMMEYLFELIKEKYILANLLNDFIGQSIIDDKYEMFNFLNKIYVLNLKGFRESNQKVELNNDVIFFACQHRNAKYLRKAYENGLYSMLQIDIDKCLRTLVINKKLEITNWIISIVLNEKITDIDFTSMMNYLVEKMDYANITEIRIFYELYKAKIVIDPAETNNKFIKLCDSSNLHKNYELVLDFLFSLAGDTILSKYVIKRGLYKTCYNGNIDVTKYLLKKCIEREIEIDFDLNGLFVRLAIIGNCEHIELLCDFADQIKKPIDYPNNLNYAFLQTCINNHLEMSKWIYLKSLERQAPVDLMSKSGLCFFIVCYNNFIQLANYLVTLTNCFCCNANKDEIIRWTIQGKESNMDDYYELQAFKSKEFFRRGYSCKKKDDVLVFKKDIKIEKAVDLVDRDYDSTIELLKIKKCDKELAEEYFQCLICKDIKANIIVFLCSHSYCLHCILEWMRLRHDYRCLFCFRALKWKDCTSYSMQSEFL